MKCCRKGFYARRDSSDDRSTLPLELQSLCVGQRLGNLTLLRILDAKTIDEAHAG